MIVAPSAMNTSSTAGNASGSRAAQQDMYAAVVPAGEQHRQQRATDEAGDASEQGGARGCNHVVTTLPASLEARNGRGEDDSGRLMGYSTGPAGVRH